LHKHRGLMATMRQWQASIAVLLYGILLFGSIVSAVAHSRQAAEQNALGPAGLVICIASEDGVLDAVHRSRSTHHYSECCVLCTISHTVRVHDLVFLPHAIAFEPITSIAEFHFVFYPVPDIALSDGVFPYDIPARAPPVLIV